jgi:copper(I)-binding protein
MRLRLPQATVVALLIGSSGCNHRDAIDISAAWIRAAAPGAPAAAGYFEAVNHGRQAIALVGAHSDGCAAVELHTHISDGQMMGMRRLERLEMPPDTRIAFAPGGHHLMLLDCTDVTSPTRAVTLQFSDGSERTVAFELRSVTGD